MDVQEVAVKRQYAEYQVKFATLASAVNSAVSNANQFYQAIAGAQGVLKWLANNIPGVNLGAELCGRSTPSWCDFSEVR